MTERQMDRIERELLKQGFRVQRAGGVFRIVHDDEDGTSVSLRVLNGGDGSPGYVTVSFTGVRRAKFDQVREIACQLAGV